MTARQVANVDALKAASAEFTTMRHLAMRLRGLLRSGTAEKLDIWLNDARECGIYGMRRVARTLRQDIQAVRNAAKAERGFRGYPSPTVALYGRDDTRASKLTVGIVPAEAPNHRRWASRRICSPSRPAYLVARPGT
jgi:hypothetical protein